MSDEFDKNDDDMSWLDDEFRGDDDNDGSEADAESFDWEKSGDGDGEGGERDTGRLGFTGMLSWRGSEGDNDEGGASADDDGLAFDWQADGTDDEGNRGGDPSRLGFTGMLSWQQQPDADDDDPADVDPGDFLFDDDSAAPVDEPGSLSTDEDDAGDSGFGGMFADMGGDDAPPADDFLSDDEEDEDYDDLFASAPAEESASSGFGSMFADMGGDDAPPVDDFLSDDDDDEDYDDLFASATAGEEPASSGFGSMFGDMSDDDVVAAEGQPYDEFGDMDDLDMLRMSGTGLTDAVSGAEDDFDEDIFGALADDDGDGMDDLFGSGESEPDEDLFAGFAEDATDDRADTAQEVYDDFAGISDLEMLRRSRTGLTDLTEGEDFGEDIFGGLDDAGEAAAPPVDELGSLSDEEILRRSRTGLTGLTGSGDDDFDFGDDDELDLSFLDEAEEAEPATPVSGALPDPDDEFEFLSEMEDQMAEPSAPVDDFAGMSDLEILRMARTGLTDAVEDAEDPDIEVEEDLPDDVDTGGLAAMFGGEPDMRETTEEDLAALFADDDDDDIDLSFLGDADDDALALENAGDFAFTFDDDEGAVAADIGTPVGDSFADDFLASLGEDDSADDAFSFDTSSTDVDEDLFADLSLDDDLGMGDEPEPADLDFLDPDATRLSVEDDLPEGFDDPAEPEYQDLDDLLATFDEREVTPQDLAPPPGTDELSMADLEFEEPEPLPPRPGFLQDINVGDSESSAAAYVRGLDNRPDDELDDQLYDLRQRGLNLKRTADVDPEMQNILPGVADTLSEPGLRTEPEPPTEGVRMTRDQKREMELLQGMVAADVLPRSSVQPDDADGPDDARDLLGDDDDLLDLSDFVDPAVEQAKAERKPRQRVQPLGRRRVSPGRVVIALLLIAAVALPFFGVGLFGDPPPPTFDDTGAQAAVFETIGTISPRDYVLFAVDYGPSNAAELDPILEATVKHTMARGGFPVLVGRNPVGISRTEDIMDAVAEDPLFDGRQIASGTDYFIVGFLPGGEAALVDLASSPQTVLATDISGNETGIRALTLDNLAAIVLLAGTPDDVRVWAEQIATRTSTPLVAGVGNVSEDIARQYFNAPDGLDGLLVSIEDASTYNQLLNDQVADNVIDPFTVPTATFTPSPTPTTTPSVTPIGFIPTETPEGFVPSPTPDGFVPYAVFGIGNYVVVDSGGAINARGGPGTNFDVVGTAAPNQVLIVQREAENALREAWTQVLLADGTNGWILNDFLVAADDEQAAAGQTQVAQFQPQPTDTPTLTPTVTETPTPTATPTSIPTETLVPTETEPVPPEAGSLTLVSEDGSEIPLLQLPVNGSPVVNTLPPGEMLEFAGFVEGPDGINYAAAEFLSTTVYINEDNIAVDVEPPTGVDIPIPTIEGGQNIESMVREDGDIDSMVQPDDSIDSMVQQPTEEIDSMVQEGATEEATVDAATATPLPTDPPTVEAATDAPTATEPPTDVPVPTDVPQFLDEGTVVVTSFRTAINARSGPGTNFERVDVLPPGSRLQVVGNNDDGRWVEVRLPDGRDAFVFRDLVTVDLDGDVPTLAPSVTPEPPTDEPTETPSDTPTPTPIPLDAEGLVARVISRNAVNVRTGPSRGFQPIAPLNPGSVVNILGASEDENWLEIQLPDGRTGWIIADATEILLGATVLEEATATAAAGGDARVPQVREATVLPTLELDDDNDVPGRVALPEGSLARVRGFENVNIREAPRSIAPVVGLLPSGESAPARILSADQNWVFIESAEGQEGWVSRVAVILVSPEQQGLQTGTPSPTPTPTDTPTPLPPTATPAEGEGEAAPVEGESRREFNPRVMSRVQRVPSARRLQQDSSEGSGTITAGAVANVRGGPGLEFDVVGTAQPNEIVPVLSITESGDWVEIRLIDDTEGFISAALIDVTQEPAPPEASATEEADESATEEAATEVPPEPTPAVGLDGEGLGEINGESAADLYAGPGLSFDVVGSVPAGTEVGVRGFEVSDANNETWVRIRLEDDTIGYVNADRVVVSQFPTISEAFEETIETEEPDLAPIETTLEEEPTEAETEEAPAEADESTAVPSATPLPTDEALASAQGADGLADGEGLAVVSGDDAIEVRQGPGETFDVIATADSGTELPVRGLEGTDDGETWLRVRLEDGTIGYVNASAVTVETFPTLSEPFVVASDATPVPEVSPAGAISAASPTDGENAGSGTVTGDATVDVRLGPSADFDVIATAEPDTELLVRGLSAGESGETWVRVQLEDGTVGYINADNVNVTAFPAVDEPFDTAELVREGDALQPPAVTTAEPDDAAPSALATNVARVNPPTPTATPLVVAAAPPQGIVVDAGQVDTSLERQAFAVRLGLITSAVIIGLGGLINALTSRRKG